MQIDWLTVSAQILNFLILVWLLKRFLYQPVLNVMAHREERIAARLEEAGQREAEAQEQGRIYREKITELEQERQERLAQAREESERNRRRLLEEARRDIDKQREHWREELHREQEALSKMLKRVLAESATRIAQRVLADLADAGIQRQVVATFLNHLQALSEDERQPLIKTSKQLRLTAAFGLNEETREGLDARLRDLFGVPLELQYARDPELVCGITLAGSGHKIEWNIADYLAGFERRIEDLLGDAHTAQKEHG